MKFLLEIPIIASFASWVWLDDADPEVDPETCILGLPFMNGGCWSRLLAKGIGIAIIASACLNKVPVMKNILDSKSAEGLAKASVYGEVLIFGNSSMYGILEGHPITAFGENVSLWIQCAIIMLMVWHFGKVAMSEILVVSMLLAIYIGVSFTQLPTDLHYVLITMSYPVNLYAKGSQILESYRVRHTGALSIVTLSMNIVGGSIRIATTMNEVGMDLALITGFGIGVFLNVVQLVQYYQYKENTLKFYQGAAKDKRKQE